MIAAIIGDMFGSVYERIPDSNKSPAPTDDSCATIAAALWCKSVAPGVINGTIGQAQALEMAQEELRKQFFLNPKCGWSKNFTLWAKGYESKVYPNSSTNGCLMRQSSIIDYCVKNSHTEDFCLKLCELFAMSTHNHPQSLKAVSEHASLCFTSAKMPVAKKNIAQYGYYGQIQTLDYWRQECKNTFIWSAQDSFKIALSILWFANSFDDVIDNAIYVGADVDTYCSIACPIAYHWFETSQSKYYSRGLEYLQKNNPQWLEILNF